MEGQPYDAEDPELERVIASIGEAPGQAASEALADSLERLAAGRQARGDAPAEARARRALASLAGDLGNAELTLGQWLRLVELHRGDDDPEDELVALISAAQCEAELGALAPALERLAQALELAHAHGDRWAEGAIHKTISDIHTEAGQIELALKHATSALAVADATGEPGFRALALQALADVHDRAGAPDRATELLTDALALAREAEDRDTEATILLGLAQLELFGFEPAAALDRLEAALAILVDAGDPYELVGALVATGHAELMLGMPKEARKDMGQALDIARQVQDREAESFALYGTGMVEATSGRLESAHAHFEKAVRLASDRGGAEVEAAFRTGIGGVMAALGETSSALEHLERGLAIAEANGFRAIAAFLLGVVGSLQAQRGDLDRAEATVSRALEAAAATGRPVAEAQALMLSASIHSIRGRPELALADGEAALALADKTDALLLIGRFAHQLGTLLLNQGRLQEALDRHDRALALMRRSGDHLGEGRALVGLGNVLLLLGRGESAAESFDAALESALRSGDRGCEAMALASMGGALVGAAQNERAVGWLEESVALLEEMEWAETASVRSMLGVAAAGLGNSRQAIEQLSSSILQAGEAGNELALVGPLVRLGLAYHADGRSDAAVERLEQGLAIARKFGARSVVIDVKLQLAMVAEDRSRTEVALGELEEAVEAIGDVQASLRDDEIRSGYLAAASEAYASLARLLAAEGDLSAAFQRAEEGRARVLLRLLADPAEGTGGDSARDERLLYEALQRLDAAIADADHAQDWESSARLRHRRLELTRVLAFETETVRGIDRWKPSELRPPPAVWSLADVETHLGDRALLEYVLGERGSVLIASAGGRRQAFELPPRAEIETLTGELRAAVVHGHDFGLVGAYPHGNALYRVLVEPALDVIGERDLVIAADGLLHYLPFALLLTEESKQDAGRAAPHTAERRQGPMAERAPSGMAPEQERAIAQAVASRDDDLPEADWASLPYLLHERAVTMVPSGTSFAVLARRARARTEGHSTEIAAFGDPIVEPRLKHAGAEIDTLTRLCRERASEGAAIVSLTGSDFTKDKLGAALGEIGSCRLAHFATHGALSEERGVFCGLTLTPGDRWHVYEIARSTLVADCVTLSACETGRGELLAGEGVIGLTRAFLQAGANAVCASLWKVDDRSTAELMSEFYRGMLEERLPAAHALRAAQLTALGSRTESSFHHPFHWAPFVVSGWSG